MKPYTSHGKVSEHLSADDVADFADDGADFAGWFSRLSAPGYLDCTDWLGPFDTELEAVRCLWEHYGDECQSVDDVCQYASGFADFWLGYTQSLGFTASDHSPGGEGLFGGPGDFDDNWPGCFAGHYGESLLYAERQELLNDAAGFYFNNLADIVGEESQAGHDFHLARNHHGAGFWDGYWSEDVGKRLTEASHIYGTCELVGRRDENGDTIEAFLSH